MQIAWWWLLMDIISATMQLLLAMNVQFYKFVLQQHVSQQQSCMSTSEDAWIRKPTMLCSTYPNIRSHNPPLWCCGYACVIVQQLLRNRTL